MSSNETERSVDDMQGHLSKEMMSLKSEVSLLKREIRERDEEAGAVNLLIGDVIDAVERVKPVKWDKPVKRTGKVASPCSHVLHLTDLHYGMVTKPEQTEEFGEYSPLIAERRIKFLAQKIIDKTDIQRSAYNVDELVILGTADWISGGIHPELLSTNAFPEPVQAVKAGYLIGNMIMQFAPNFPKIRVELITQDNHGRLTKKPQAADGGLNNWGFVVANIVKEYVKEQKNVDVNVHAASSAIVPVGPEQYLIFHGHTMRGWNGLPYYGFDRRVQKEAVTRMNAPSDKHYTKMVFGHFHVAFNGDYWMSGGSVSGTDAFDHSQGRHSEPHQTSWLVHRGTASKGGHGAFDWTRWMLTNA